MTPPRSGGESWPWARDRGRKTKDSTLSGAKHAVTFSCFQHSSRLREWKGGGSRWQDSAHRRIFPSLTSHAPTPTAQSGLPGAREELSRCASWELESRCREPSREKPLWPTYPMMPRGAGRSRMCAWHRKRRRPPSLGPAILWEELKQALLARRGPLQSVEERAAEPPSCLGIYRKASAAWSPTDSTSYLTTNRTPSRC